MTETRSQSWRAEYPYASHFHELDGPRMHYLDEGEGEPVVCVHGNPTWSFFYRNLVAGLKDQHRCLVPDHVGCGLSDKLQDYPYCLRQHIDNLEHWLEALQPGPFNLVVHDWGGAIGLGLAGRRPEWIRRIIVLNTAAFPFASIPRRIALCRTPLIGEWMLRRLNAFVRAATFMTTEKPLSTVAKAGFTHPYDCWDNRVAIARFVQDIPMQPTHPSYGTLVEVREGLQFLRDKPVEIHWGMKDWCFHGGILKEWPQHLPQAAVHRYENAGHYLLEDAGDEVIPAIRRFLVG